MANQLASFPVVFASFCNCSLTAFANAWGNSHPDKVFKLTAPISSLAVSALLRSLTFSLPSFAACFNSAKSSLFLWTCSKVAAKFLLILSPAFSASFIVLACCLISLSE